MISKGLGGILNSPQKTNEKIRPTILCIGWLVFVRFLGELKTPKSPFEINRPLVNWYFFNTDCKWETTLQINVSFLDFNTCTFLMNFRWKNTGTKMLRTTWDSRSNPMSSQTIRVLPVQMVSSFDPFRCQWEWQELQTKILAENRDSKRHLLELSWAI